MRTSLEEQTPIKKLLSISRLKGFSIKVSEYLYKRFNNHLRNLKNLYGNSFKRQQWIKNAFIEKLKNQEENLDILTQKWLHFKLESEIHEDIDAQVEKIKKFRNFSKKQWMLEAIYEKLDREEQQTKKILEEKLKS